MKRKSILPAPTINNIMAILASQSPGAVSTPSPTGVVAENHHTITSSGIPSTTSSSRVEIVPRKAMTSLTQMPVQVASKVGHNSSTMEPLKSETMVSAIDRHLNEPGTPEDRPDDLLIPMERLKIVDDLSNRGRSRSDEMEFEFIDLPCKKTSRPEATNTSVMTVSCVRCDAGAVVRFGVGKVPTPLALDKDLNRSSRHLTICPRCLMKGGRGTDKDVGVLHRERGSRFVGWDCILNLLSERDTLSSFCHNSDESKEVHYSTGLTGNWIQGIAPADCV